MYFFDVAGKKWVAGFWWQMLESKNVFSSARELIEEQRMINGDVSAYDYMILQKIIPYQVGLGTSADAMIPKGTIHSAALAISKVLPEEQLYRLQIDTETTWILAILEGGIVHSDGDQIFENFREAELEEAWERLNREDGWPRQHIILDVDETKQFLETHLPKAKLASYSALRPTKKKLPLKKLFLLFFLFAVSFGVYYGYHYYQEMKLKKLEEEFAMQMEELERQKMIEQIQQQEVLPEASEYFPPVWQNAEFVSDMSAYCQKNFYSQKIFDGHGWEVMNWTCNPTITTTRWSRIEGGSFINRPKDSLFAYVDPNTTETNKQRKELAVERGSESLISTRDSAAMVYETASKLNFVINAVWNQPETKIVKVGKDEVAVIAPFRVASVTIKTNVTPFEALPRFSNIPGIVLSEISWDRKNNDWTVKMDLYTER